MSAEPTPTLLTKGPPRLGVDNTYTLWNYRQAMWSLPPPAATKEKEDARVYLEEGR